MKTISYCLFWVLPLDIPMYISVTHGVFLVRNLMCILNSKCLLSTHCFLDMILGAVDMVGSLTNVLVLSLWSLHYSEKVGH